MLYTFSQTDANGENTDGADCYEPLVETDPGVFYGAANYGGTNGNGVVFRYSLSAPGVVDVVHDFSATTAGANWDGAGPDGPLDSRAGRGALLERLLRRDERQRCDLRRPT